MIIGISVMMVDSKQEYMIMVAEGGFGIKNSPHEQHDCYFANFANYFQERKWLNFTSNQSERCS